MTKTLITGVSGFAGSHLAQYLAKKSSDQLFGTFLTDSSLANIESLTGSLKPVQLDLNDKEKVKEVIQDIKPDVVYHLAAFAAPSQSFSNPTETISNNVNAQLNLLEAIRSIELKSRILIISSADIYGSVKKEELPISENVPANPNNPYSLSKLFQDELGLQYFMSYKMDIIRARPFNHIGPRQSPYFAVPTFAKKIAEIEKGKNPPVIKVGNLDTKRDFTDVRDMVRAYALLMEKGQAGDVYNIGSGNSYLIKDVLDMLISLSTVKIEIQQDPSLLRPTDNPELRADSSKIHNLTGWKPEINLEQSLKDTLDYYRNIV